MKDLKISLAVLKSLFPSSCLRITLNFNPSLVYELSMFDDLILGLAVSLGVFPPIIVITLVNMSQQHLPPAITISRHR